MWYLTAEQKSSSMCDLVGGTGVFSLPYVERRVVLFGTACVLGLEQERLIWKAHLCFLKLHVIVIPIGNWRGGSVQQD